MNANTSIPNTQPQPKKSDLGSGLVKRLTQVAFVILIYAAILFLTSSLDSTKVEHEQSSPKRMKMS